MSSVSLSLLLLSLAVRGSVQLCAPDCSGVDPGTKVRDPTDCTKYYECIYVSGEIEPSAEPVSCPDGNYFNDGHTVPRCDSIADAPNDFCYPLCNPCLPHCTSPGEVTPNPTNCSSYYVCLKKDHLLEVECPVEAPFFDFMTGGCQSDDTLCYAYCNICEPHCTEYDQRVPDPLDCTRFYHCTPPTMSNFLCPHHQVFNRVSAQCEDNADCIVDC